jgi:hypothetical protein
MCTVRKEHSQPAKPVEHGESADCDTVDAFGPRRQSWFLVLPKVVHVARGCGENGDLVAVSGDHLF